jgi:hypothetical protein
MKILAIDLGKYNRVACLFTPGTNSLNMKQSAPMVIILRTVGKNAARTGGDGNEQYYRLIVADIPINSYRHSLIRRCTTSRIDLGRENCIDLRIKHQSCTFSNRTIDNLYILDFACVSQYRNMLMLLPTRILNISLMHENTIAMRYTAIIIPLLVNNGIVLRIAATCAK